MNGSEGQICYYFRVFFSIIYNRVANVVELLARRTMISLSIEFRTLLYFDEFVSYYFLVESFGFDQCFHGDGFVLWL